MPQVSVATPDIHTMPLTLTSEDLRSNLESLKAELHRIQNRYFEDLWQVYRRADSVRHTIKFMIRKSISRLGKRSNL